MSGVVVKVVVVSWLSLLFHSGIDRNGMVSATTPTPTPDLGVDSVSGTDVPAMRPATNAPTTRKPTTAAATTAAATTAAATTTAATTNSANASAGVITATSTKPNVKPGEQKDCPDRECIGESSCENNSCNGCNGKPEDYRCALLIVNNQEVGKMTFTNQCELDAYNSNNKTVNVTRFYYEKCKIESDFWDGSRVFPLVAGVYAAVLIVLAIATTVLHGSVTGEYSVKTAESSTVVKNQAYVGPQ